MQDAYTDRLSDYLDDEDLSANERNRLTAHLAVCGACREVLADLRQIRAAATALHDDVPASDLWPEIAAQIQPPVVAQVAAFRPRRTSRRFSFTLPQLVAAGLALMVLSGGAVWLARYGGSQTDFEPIQAQTTEPELGLERIDVASGTYDRAIAELERALDRERAQLDPETLRVIDDNLRAIDRAIDDCRRALGSDRANVYLASHLFNAQKRKLAILRRASTLADARS
jgi:anti-sigma factor RsiW